MLISAKDINEIDVIWKNMNNATPSTTINVWMLAPEIRKGSLAGHPASGKPGVIYIRGLASK